MPESEANDQEGRCQVFGVHSHQKCGLPVADGDKCILHSENPEKDISQFQSMVDRIIEESDFKDFSSVVFPKTGWQLPRRFDTPISFLGAKFLGDVDFESVIFEKSATFIATSFSANADFRGVEFLETGDFSGAQFQKAIFSNSRFASAGFVGTNFHESAEFYGTIFRDSVDFTWADFAEGLSLGNVVFGGMGRFIETKFNGETDFSLSQFEKPEDISFHRCNLSRVRFINCDLSRPRFSLITWNSERTRYSMPRNKVYDEIRPKPEDLEAVAELYRDLQINYSNRFRYSEAGDFYVGEQEIMRKIGSIGHRCMANVYKIISFYGQSALLPFLWLTILLFAAPSLLLLNGIDLNTGTVARPTYNHTEYDLGYVKGGMDHLLDDYIKSFGLNMALVSRTTRYQLPADSIQQFIITIETFGAIILTAFLVLALRRRFKRKSF